MPSCYSCLGAPRPVPLNLALCGRHGAQYVVGVMAGQDPHPGRVQLGLFEPAAVAPEVVEAPAAPAEPVEPLPGSVCLHCHGTGRLDDDGAACGPCGGTGWVE